MQDFPSNSRKAAQARNQEPSRLERVTSADATVRRKSLGRQIRRTFIAGDPRIAIEYMITDVVVPAIKDMVSEAFHSGVDSMIYGEGRRSSTRRNRPTTYSDIGHVDYQGYSRNPPRARPQTTVSTRARTQHDFGEIIIPSLQEAHEVIDTLIELLSRQGYVPVADLYALTGVRQEHTDHKWGWTDLRGARARRLRDGRYILDLPEPQPLS